MRAKGSIIVVVPLLDLQAVKEIRNLVVVVFGVDSLDRHISLRESRFIKEVLIIVYRNLLFACETPWSTTENW